MGDACYPGAYRRGDDDDGDDDDDDSRGWRCGNTDFCSEGRPLLVDGKAVVAAVAEVSNWGVDPASPTPLPPSPVRNMIGHHWLRVAQMEHASIASFSRFALQLLEHGAPADLLAETSAAMVDEVRHAQDAFALASRYLDRPCGPGPLAVAGALDRSTLHQLVHSLVREACVGETLAVAVAIASRRHATDRQVVNALDRIVTDETRHAALGWKALAWALGRANAPHRTMVRRWFRDACHEATSLHGDDEACEIRKAHGVLGSKHRAEAVVQGVEGIVLPCAKALLTSLASAQHATPSASAPVQT